MVTAQLTECEVGPQGFHLRNPALDASGGCCLECGQSAPGYALEHTELLLREPPPGAVVLTEGPEGTAWQRFFSDDSWHSASGRRSTWEALMAHDRPGSRIRLVYVPPESTG